MPTDLSQQPQSQACRLIDFSDAEVRSMFLNNTYILIVVGTKPYSNMDVMLVPRIYVEQPEFWEIEVVGCLNGLGLPAEAPFHVSLPLSSCRGKKGIDVIGMTSRKRFEIAGG